MSNKADLPEENEVVEPNELSLEENLRLLDDALVNAIETVRARVKEPAPKSIYDLRTV